MTNKSFRDYINLIETAQQGVAEGRVAQLPTHSADYSKYDTDHLKMMLRPGILHRDEARFKSLIRKELQKREQQNQQGVEEAGPFSYGAKTPRKGSVAANVEQKRKEQDRGKQPVEPRDQMVGVAKVKQGVAEGEK